MQLEPLLLVLLYIDYILIVRLRIMSVIWMIYRHRRYNYNVHDGYNYFIHLQFIICMHLHNQTACTYHVYNESLTHCCLHMLAKWVQLVHVVCGWQPYVRKWSLQHTHTHIRTHKYSNYILLRWSHTIWLC